MFTFKRIRIGAGVIAIVVIGVFVWQKNYSKPFVPRDFGEVVAELKDPKKIERYTEQLMEAYKNDAYGGDTPEETLNLFISALKAGDTDLAAKYFLLEEQEKMREELQTGKEKSTISSFVKILESEKNGSGKIEGNYTFTYDTPTSLMSVDLFLNPYTKKWKIESL